MQAQFEAILRFSDADLAKDFVLEQRDDLRSRSIEDYMLYQFRARDAGELVYYRGPDTVGRYAARPGVVSVSTSTGKLSSRSIPNDPRYSEQWNLDIIDAAGAWDFTTGGTTAIGDRIVTGVIELDGYDFSNQELQGRLFENTLEIPGNGLDDDNNGFIDDTNGFNFETNSSVFDADAHGVKVCGLLGATTDDGLGVAAITWDASLLPTVVKSIDQWTVALDYYTALRERFNDSNGAEGALVATINMSLGSSGASCRTEIEFNEALDRAGRAGILPVAATDNELDRISDTSPDFPSTCASDFLLVVTASTREDEIFGNSRTSTTHVDLAAPGDFLPSVTYSSLPPTFVGTSAATPHVAATISLAYSLPCEQLARQITLRPAATARLMRDAVLESVDNRSALENEVATGGRLNVRRAIENVLATSCLDGDVIVQFAEGVVAPATIAMDTIDYVLQRSLSEQWNFHLYQSSSVDVQAAATALRGRSDVRLACANLQFSLRGRRPSDPGYSLQGWAYQMGLPAAWQSVYGDSERSPDASQVVTAVLDQNFSSPSESLEGRVLVNEADIPGNQLDDDNNGYVDDRLGINLSNRSAELRQGTHGVAIANLLAAIPDDGLGIAGVDWAGKLLQIQGSSLDHWIEGADYVERLRKEYNQASGASGALVASYVLPQGANYASTLQDINEAVGFVSQALLQAGIATLLAGPNGLLNDDASDISDGSGSTHYTIRSAEIDGPDDPLDTRSLFAPSMNLVYDVSASDTSYLSGTSGASALTAGAISLLYQALCEDDKQRITTAPEEISSAVMRQLVNTSSPVTREGVPQIRPDFAVDALQTGCLESQAPCRVFGISPNPMGLSQNIRITYGSSDTNRSCPLRVTDALGRVIVPKLVPPAASFNTIEIESSSWPTGTYYLTIGTGGQARTHALLQP